MKPAISILLALLFSTMLCAQDQTASTEAPIPPKITGPDEIRPSVRIERQGDEIHEIYTQAGQVYMVRVTPKNGTPYYLIDTDGDGDMETRTEEWEKVRPVYWKLFTW